MTNVTTWKCIVRSDRRIIVPEEYPPGEAIEVTVRPLKPVEKDQEEE